MSTKSFSLVELSPELSDSTLDAFRRYREVAITKSDNDLFRDFYETCDLASFIAPTAEIGSFFSLYTSDIDRACRVLGTDYAT